MEFYVYLELFDNKLFVFNTYNETWGNYCNVDQTDINNFCVLDKIQNFQKPFLYFLALQKRLFRNIRQNRWIMLDLDFWCWINLRRSFSSNSLAFSTIIVRSDVSRCSKNSGIAWDSNRSTIIFVFGLSPFSLKSALDFILLFLESGDNCWFSIQIEEILVTGAIL